MVRENQDNYNDNLVFQILKFRCLWRMVRENQDNKNKVPWNNKECDNEFLKSTIQIKNQIQKNKS